MCDESLATDYRCALVVDNGVETRKVEYRNQCELDAAQAMNGTETYNIYRFYFEKCVYEGTAVLVWAL